MITVPTESFGNSFLGNFLSESDLPNNPNAGDYASVGGLLYVYESNDWVVYSFEGMGISNSDESYSFDIPDTPLMGFVPMNQGEIEGITYNSLIEEPPYQVTYKIKDGDDWQEYTGAVVNMIKKEVGRIENE